MEVRRLLAVDIPPGLVPLEWRGQRVEAFQGGWILGVRADSALIKNKTPGEQSAAVDKALATRNKHAQVDRPLGSDGQYLLSVPDTLPYPQLLRSAMSLPGFRYLEPNFRLDLQSTFPNDPYFNYEYGLHNTGSTPLGPSTPDADIDAPEAWDLTTGSPDVVVGLIDSGVDYTHVDLAANVWTNPFEVVGDGIDNDGNGYVDDVRGIDPADHDTDPMDTTGHGTHVAGTIAAVGNNATGVTGVSWRSKVMPLKMFTSTGAGSTAAAIECINYATNMRKRGVNVRLTNNSWGELTTFSQGLYDAIRASGDAGMLFVAAAGNGGADAVGDNNDAAPKYPASYDLPNVISVAATDRNDQLATLSNYGATSVDLAAPGVDVTSTVRGNQYGFQSGTSQAAPHVSGVAALAWSLKPAATYAEVRDAIFAGVDKLPQLAGKVATGGRLNAYNTLQQLKGSVSGAVYNDADASGTRGASEAGIAGRTVYLDLDNSGTLTAADLTTTTDASGNYSFTGLASGTYTLRQVVPAGSVSTAPPAGAYTVQLAPGQSASGLDFGTRQQPTGTPPTATVNPLPDVTSSAVSTYYFTVNYTDDVAVDYRTIGAGDVVVTGPNGYSQAGRLANLTTPDGGKSWQASYTVTAPGGSWDAGDNGTYTVSLQPNEVADTSGTFAAAATLGTFAARMGDTTPPTATAAKPPDVTAAGGVYQFVTVTYTDANSAIDYRTIDGNDVVLTGPNGFSQTGYLANLATTNPSTWTATYRFTAPGGTWDAADNGIYTVSVQPSQVADTAGNFVAAGPVTQFAVRANDPSPPTATAVATDVTAAGGPSYYFKVTYRDDVAVDYRTIGAGDVLVTGPNGYSQTGSLANLTTPDGGRTWEATYLVSAPGGTWDAADNGTYNLQLQPAQVADTSGNFAAAGVLGTFRAAVGA